MEKITVLLHGDYYILFLRKSYFIADMSSKINTMSYTEMACFL